MKFITERGGGRPPSDLTFTMPSECEIFSGGLRELSRITHQLGKWDLEPKSGFPDATGSHPENLFPISYHSGEYSNRCPRSRVELTAYPTERNISS